MDDALRSDDEPTRDQAWSGLYERHWAVPSRETVALVPHLLGLLADGAYPYPEEVLQFLASLVEMPTEDWNWAPGGLDAQRLAESPVASAIHAAAADGVPLAARLLAAGPPITGAAAQLLAWFPERAAEILPGLRRLHGRGLPSVDRATALIALGLLAGAAGDQSDVPELERVLANDRDPDRWAAAVALAAITAPEMPRSAIATLVAELGLICRDEDLYLLTPRTRFRQGRVADIVRAVLGGLPAGEQEYAEQQMALVLAGVGALDPDDAEALARELVNAAFSPLGAGSPADLTPFQRVVLRSLAAGEVIWWSGSLGPWMTEFFSLPGTRDALAAWLDGAG